MLYICSTRPQTDAEIAYKELSVVAGLKPYNPNGAMYMMFGVELSKFPHINSTVQFMEKLMCEESVFILPGEVSVWEVQYMAVMMCIFTVFQVSWLHQVSVANIK